MLIWSAGLATRASARRASMWGGIACLIQATRGMIAAVTGLVEKPHEFPILWFIGAGFFPLLLMVAGICLWRRDEWPAGALAGIFVTIDLALFSPAPTTIVVVTALAVKASLLILILNGTRGALALEKVDYSEEVRSVFR